MSELEPSDPSSWGAIRKRLLRFVTNTIQREQTIDKLVSNQSKHSEDIHELEKRMARIEAQQEVIIRLLERDQRE